MTARAELERPAGRPQANILGIGVDAVAIDSATDRLQQAAQHGGGHGYVCVTGVHGVMEAQRDPTLRRILNASVMTVPDGMPTVWVGRAQGYRQMSRVYGPDLMLALCERSVSAGQTHFLYGGGPGTAERLKAALEARFPGIRIVGTFTPPFRPLNSDEERELEAAVGASEPNFFWVGLSTPKQERFMAQYVGRLRTPLMLGVGAAFDMNSGQLKQAPRWMQRAGLEWLFRLLMEPRRLAGRYFRNNPAFIALILMQLLGLRRDAIDVAV